MQLLLLEPGDEDKGGDKVERDQHKDKGIAQRPCDSEAFSRPEGAETGKHNANDKFERVLWHLLEWARTSAPREITSMPAITAPMAAELMPQDCVHTFVTALLPKVMTMNATSSPSSKTAL